MNSLGPGISFPQALSKQQASALVMDAYLVSLASGYGM